MSKKLVSVIMAVYNTDEKYLKASIESILNQTYKNIEFIIINDCSNRRISEIIKNYYLNDTRIKLLINKRNLGLTKSLNRGLALAKGKYIARMDSDDISKLNRLEKQFNYMEQDQKCIMCCSYAEDYGSQKIIKIFWSKDIERQRIRMLFKNSGIIHPSVFFRNSFLKKNKIRYDENIKKSQDYDLWVRLLEKDIKIVVIPERLIVYRRHSEQISQRSKEEQNNYANIIRYNQIIKIDKKISQNLLKTYYKMGNIDEQLNKNDIKKFNKYILSKIENSNKINLEKLKSELYIMWFCRIVYEIKSRKKFNFLLDNYTLNIFKPRIVISLLDFLVFQNSNIKEKFKYFKVNK